MPKNPKNAAQAPSGRQAPREGGTSCAEAGKMGGDAVKAKYGPGFYEEIGRKGGLKTAKRGHEFYVEIGQKGGKKGGDATKEKYGPEFYRKIGKKGGQRVRELIQAGKRSANES